MRRAVKCSVVEGKKFRKTSQTKLETQQFIARYHRLNEEIAAIQQDLTLGDQERLRKITHLESEQEKLGGLAIYQQASIRGSKLFNSSRWLIEQLDRFKSYCTGPFRLLDVGALELGYRGIDWINATYIDLRPQVPSIKKADLLTFEDANKFDVVCLALVLNFVGAAKARGRMIQKSLELLNSDGFLYIVLPIHCISNSTRMNNEQLLTKLQERNCRLIAFHQSKRLIFYLFSRNPEIVTVERPAIMRDRSKPLNAYDIE